jgi:thiol-disulfide isomerase/thioredoxin
MPLPIIKDIQNRNHFLEIIQNNPGVIIIKFGAKWCGPCQLIEKDLDNTFSIMPNNVQCMNIDIDLCPDVYSFLRSKRVVNGIPAILCYRKGNISYIPDDMVIGADKNAIRDFFARIVEFIKQ